jgi:hypothetical protein
MLRVSTLVRETERAEVLSREQLGRLEMLEHLHRNHGVGVVAPDCPGCAAST